MNTSKFIYNIVFGIIIVIALFMLSTILPLPGHYEIKIVKSGSMEPAIHTGSIVVIKPAANYAVGDVITFGKDTKNDVPTTHRIVAERAEEGQMIYQTKGDANDTPDGETPQTAVIGKVEFSVPFAGYIIAAARQPVGFFFLIIVPAAIVAIEEIGSIWREIKKMRAKKRNLENSDETRSGETSV
ncbi:MAG TPA: signal peptidase I [Candidatus Paceibacterota bacterium]|jgi:signal peptidase|nr:signal peptidase I [Candidatus Paceibacterota bacterium]